MTLDEMRQLDAVKSYKELEEAKAEIERLRKANFQLREGAEEQKQRIKRLEETGDYLCAAAAFQLERELNAANTKIKRLEEFVDQLTNPKFTRDDLPKEALLQRIKRLEEAGDAMAEWLENPRNLGADATLSHAWREAKEAKL